jgi:hypothetical protein
LRIRVLSCFVLFCDLFSATLHPVPHTVSSFFLPQYHILLLFHETVYACLLSFIWMYTHLHHYRFQVKAGPGFHIYCVLLWRYNVHTMCVHCVCILLYRLLLYIIVCLCIMK